jgi:carboxymethylenebutenolidase
MPETKLSIPMAGGSAEAFLYTPSGGTGPWPGVLYLTDIFGIRPAFQAMAQRLADEGFAVLMPNAFFRAGPLPLFDFPPVFGEEKTMKRFGELRVALLNDAMGPDAAVYADALKARLEVKGTGLGVAGYCFTGQMSLRAAAAAPDRFSAALSFHGGHLYTDDADSPHLLLPRVKARLYFGHATNDHTISAEQIKKLEAALSDWGGDFESETYDALHGWCVPGREGIYNAEKADRAFAKMVAVLKAALK